MDSGRSPGRPDAAPAPQADLVSRHARRLTSETARRDEAARLDGEILAAIGRGWSAPLDDAAFDELARAIFAHQFRFHPVYRQFCQLQGVSAPADVASWREIPSVPAGAFKVGRWATFPPAAEVAAFETSGTTQGAAGRHAFDTLALYNAAIVPAARRLLVPDLEPGGRMRCLFLTPPPAAAPASSLVHMFAVFREVFGAAESAYLPAGERAGRQAAAQALARALEATVRSGEPVLLAGPALAFRHVLTALGDRRWELPAGSRAMVTGGFKGRRADAEPDQLAEDLATRLTIPRTHQVPEYGMTELSSQCYGAGLRQALGLDVAGSVGTFLPPPWMRVRVVEPLTGQELPPGDPGALVFTDLANRGSAVMLQTSDLGMADAAGFTLAGREPGAEARGCSLAADLWLDAP
ncbi:MAG: acyl-protein synthetase [Gemmatimonadota bacterium]